jgi:CheY-like chemotaxis protein
MPEISGYTLAEKLRKDGIDVPLIAITAALPDKKDWVNRFDSLILKPYRKKELLMAVMSYLRGDSDPVSGTVQSNSKEGYSLESIKEFAHDDKEMLQRLIRTFIKNAESGLRKMEGESDIRIIAETAHKLLPSFRHLQAQSLVDKLETLKESGKESTPLDPKEIVGEIVLESRELIEKLKKEL